MNSLLVIITVFAAIAADSVTRIRVLQQNVQLTPIVGGSDQQQIARAGKIRDAILHANPPYDVITLEEVFTEQPMQVLIDGLSPLYPNILTAIPDGKKLTGSGLFFASRFPVRRSKFHKYTQASGFDALVPKGILVAELDVAVNGAVGSLFVAHTHQQAGGTDDIMQSQLREGGDTLAGVLQTADRAMQSYTTVLYMGDMNIDEVSQPALYTQMKTGMGTSVVDLFRTLHPSDPGLTWPMPGPPNQRLDYIFSVQQAAHNPCQFGFDLQAANTTCSIDRVLFNGTLSDHFGVSAQFDMRLNPNGRPSTPTFCVAPGSGPSSSATSHFSAFTVAALLTILLGFSI